MLISFSSKLNNSAYFVFFGILTKYSFPFWGPSFIVAIKFSASHLDLSVLSGWSLTVIEKWFVSPKKGRPFVFKPKNILNELGGYDVVSIIISPFE